MTPTLKISHNVVNKLLNLKTKCFGKLYGTLFKNNLLIVGLSIDDENSLDVTHCFPTEIDLCGLVDVYQTQPCSAGRINKTLQYVDVTDNPIYISCKIGSPNEFVPHFVLNERLQSTTYEEISEQEIYSQFVHIRLKANIPLVCELTAESVKDAVQGLRKLLSSGLMVFMFPKTNVCLMGNDNENGLIGLAGDPIIADLCNQSSELNEGCYRKKKSYGVEMVVHCVSMLKRVTTEGQSLFTKPHGPIFVLDKRSRKSITLEAPIDALSMVHKDTKVIKLYEILVESSVRNLRLLESILLKKLEGEQELSLPEIFHFYPDACDHFLTRIYLKNDDEKSLAGEREKLHSQFLLAMNRPVFRRANKYLFKDESPSDRSLLNPHEGISHTGNGGEIALVKGKYRYYHYCQDNMDDNGWGCAYRSLQTLASWFVLQGLTDKNVPTFKDIQICLVDIGDKPASFIGSRQWIGSTEVNYVLDSLLGITSKIIYVSSGAELGSKGPELLYHFKTQGTPVMIGGGVLAHTILGVDYNQQTGNLKFLILDPHYTGQEDLKTIQGKGWCGWKGVEFWDKNSYYNMCLPQVQSQF